MLTKLFKNKYSQQKGQSFNLQTMSFQPTVKFKVVLLMTLKNKNEFLLTEGKIIMV